MTTSNANRPVKALLLDDDPDVLRLLGTALEAHGYAVRAAADGEAGVALLLDELLDLDVVAVDADLPGRDARALLHLVRWAGGERDLAVVVLASAPDPSAEAELRALGADAVVDRRAGLHAALASIAAAARRPCAPPVAAHGARLRPALRGALLLARAALAPAWAAPSSA
jgi:DNA-binding response OmpR family regulator